MKISKMISCRPFLRKLFYSSTAIVMLAINAQSLSADSTPAVPNVAIAEGAEPSLTNAATSKPKEKEKDPLIVTVMSLSIAILAIVLGIGVAFVAIWSDYKKRRELISFCHQERMAALEKGLDPPPFPPGILDGVHPKPNVPLDPSAPPTGLKAGLMWIANGVGWGVFLHFQNHRGLHPAIAAPLIGIGIVCLVCYAIERRAWQRRRLGRE